MKKLTKKLVLRKETLLNLRKVNSGIAGTVGGEVFTDTDTDTVPSGGPAICYFSDCNPCDTDRVCAQM